MLAAVGDGTGSQGTTWRAARAAVAHYYLFLAPAGRFFFFMSVEPFTSFIVRKFKTEKSYDKKI